METLESKMSISWDLLKPLKDEVMDLEGETVTLSCKYSGSVYNVQWYQQKSSSSPQFIIADFSAKTEKFSVQHNKQKQEFYLQISSAAVSDSAVYYCAVRPTVTGNNKTLYKNLQRTQDSITSTRGRHTLRKWPLPLLSTGPLRSRQVVAWTLLQVLIGRVQGRSAMDFLVGVGLSSWTLVGWGLLLDTDHGGVFDVVGGLLHLSFCWVSQIADFLDVLLCTDL
uniref:Ig-like domain-containing protein n=1 Tax=Oryzias melastigma TaxID=30732 RepID=A0A3B3DEZ2_ORYME